MILTTSHLHYFQSRRPLPAWAKPLTQRLQPAVSIHECVNKHAGQGRPTSADMAKSNTNNLIRSYMKRGELLPNLKRIAIHPGTVIDPELRAAYATRLLRKLGVEMPL